MANRRRGEVEIIIDGSPRTLCLTLGALAELEAAFQTEDLVALAARFETGRLTSRDVSRVIAAGLRGAGEAATAEDVAGMRFDGGVPALVRAVTEMLALTFTGGSNRTENPL